MDLQNTFYVVAIVFMTLFILLFIGVVVLMFVIQRKLSALYTSIDEKISSVKYAMDRPREIAASIGAAVADKAINSIGKMTSKKRKK
jgi:cell shape-determining protein MreC